MMERLKAWYAGLQQREQRVVLFGGIVLAVIVVVGGILLPLDSALSSAIKGRETKRDDLAWMRTNAAEVRAAGALLPPDTGEAPMIIVDRLGREAGLAAALRGTQPSATGVRVQLEGAPFDTMLTWLETLDRRYGLAIESITVDRNAAPGTVNANITFTQPQH
jgi:general secretion pathway protein M